MALPASQLTDNERYFLGVGRSLTGLAWRDRLDARGQAQALAIAQRHGISPRRAASVLDIFACIVQGVLPYGAQILLAASLAAVSPLALAGSVQYCWLLAVSALVFMLWPSRRPVQATE